MIYLKRSHFDILLFLIVFYDGYGDVKGGGGGGGGRGDIKIERCNFWTGFSQKFVYPVFLIIRTIFKSACPEVFG